MIWKIFFFSCQSLTTWPGKTPLSGWQSTWTPWKRLRSPSTMRLVILHAKHSDIEQVPTLTGWPSETGYIGATATSGEM